MANRNYLDIIDIRYPEARFIHIVRDSRAVYASLKKLTKVRHINAPIVPRTPALFSAYWLDSLQRIEDFSQKIHSERFHVVRYEDVVGKFDTAIPNVCNFLNLPFDPSMHHFDEVNIQYDLEPKTYERWKGQTRKPLTQNRVSSWEKELCEQDIEIITTLTQKKLETYKYNSHASSVVTDPPLISSFKGKSSG